MTLLPPVFQALLLLIATAAAITDIRRRRIPNSLVLMGWVSGLVLNSLAYGMPGFLASLKGAGLALLVYLPLFAFRAMGAGDAKLMAAIGAICGPVNWLGIFLITAVAGGLLAVGVVLTNKRVVETILNLGHILREAIHLRAPYETKSSLDVRNPRAATMPHAVSILIGVAVYIAASWVWAPR
jgi:prepilin peptidase CpaA